MLDYPLIAAVAAVLRTGSFEKAAQSLGLTPSAVSQRVKLLEERLGAVLVVRGQPCTATAAGQRIARHAQDVGLLEQALRTDLGMPGIAARSSLRIAVNADSLAIWFIDAMAGIDNCLFDLVIDDQQYSADWLRRGEVSAAVTASARPVQGCRIRELGRQRYIATASPAFMARWFADGVNETNLRRAPAMTFNAKDALQTEWIARILNKRITPPTHWFPSSQTFIDAALAGIAWGMNPQTMVEPHIKTGRLVPLMAGKPLDIPLYWQWSRAAEPVLKDTTDQVVRAARKALMQRK